MLLSSVYILNDSIQKGVPAILGDKVVILGINHANKPIYHHSSLWLFLIMSNNLLLWNEEIEKDVLVLLAKCLHDLSKEVLIAILCQAKWEKDNSSLCKARPNHWFIIILLILLVLITLKKCLQNSLQHSSQQPRLLHSIKLSLQNNLISHTKECGIGFHLQQFSQDFLKVLGSFAQNPNILSNELLQEHSISWEEGHHFLAPIFGFQKGLEDDFGWVVFDIVEVNSQSVDLEWIWDEILMVFFDDLVQEGEEFLHDKGNGLVVVLHEDHELG